MAARRIAFINEKGGVGKTTLAVNLAAWFALKKNRRVLLLDLDTQGHAGKSLGLDVRSLNPSMFHLLTRDDVSLDAVTRATAVPNLWVVPARKELADFPVVAASLPEKEHRLARRLEAEHDRYDMVFFDAPPSLGLVTTNILLAATEVVIPVGTTYLGLDGCAEMMATVERVSKDFAHEVKVSRVIPTLYRKSALADEILEALTERFGKRVAEPMPFNVAIDEAQGHGKTIWEYAPWSRGATILQSVAESLDRAR